MSSGLVPSASLRVTRPNTRFAACALLSLLAACATATLQTPTTEPLPPPVEREFRGVWIAAVSNLDWPSRPGLSPDSQRAELIALLDRSREMKLNAVILHMRPAGDALYISEFEPWSEYLTGEQGKAPDPYYDPLEFAVAEAHARGLELHAWFNPYRARHPSSRGPAARNHISRTNPELVLGYGSYLWMDPGEEAVRRRSIDVVMDVVTRYDVDGVHIDDYFYPYRERDSRGREIEFPDSASYGRYLRDGGKLGRSDWRRSNVDSYVSELYAEVKKAKPWVKVGISPIGTWRPNVVPQLGGFDAYESIFADSRKWLVDGNLDYFVPQIYWPIARTDVSFPVVLDWWVRQNVLGRGMYAGLIPGNVNLDTQGRGGWHPDEIIGQIYVTRGRPGAEGHVHFRMGSLMPIDTTRRDTNNSLVPLDTAHQRVLRLAARRDSLTGKLMREAYARPALVPLMPWLDASPPPPPSAEFAGARRFRVEPADGETPFLWVVQYRSGSAWSTEIIPASQREVTIRRGGGEFDVNSLWISAVDRLGNQSAPVHVVPRRTF